MNGHELRRRRQWARIGLEKFSADAGRSVKHISYTERHDLPVTEHIAAILVKLEEESGTIHQLDLFRT